MGTHLLFQHFSTATFLPKWVFWGNYWVRWPPWTTWLAHCGAWHCPSYHLGYVAGTERPIGPAFSHRRACLSPHLILLIFPIFPDWAGVCCILFPQDFKKGFEGKNKKKMLYATGWSLSDQHILSSITVKSWVLTRLVLKHMQVFSDCLWGGFLMLMYCDLLAKTLFLNW